MILSERKKGEWGHVTVKVGETVETRFNDKKHVIDIQKLYPILRSNPYIPPMEFCEKTVITPFYDASLLRDCAPTPEINRQIVDFIYILNAQGLAHRDLHINNVLVTENKIVVIDWEYVCINKVPLEHMYDLTGKGLRSPLLTGRCHVFKKGEPYLGQFLGLTMQDFKK